MGSEMAQRQKGRELVKGVAGGSRTALGQRVRCAWVEMSVVRGGGGMKAG